MTEPPYVCPYCGREFSYERSLNQHTALFESGGKCRHPGRKLNKPITKNPRLNEETLVWLEKRSIQNILLQSDGDIHKMTTAQKFLLRDNGILIQNCRRYGIRFTEKGLELLEEVKKLERKE